MHCQPKSLQLLSSWTPMIASQLKTVVANFALYTRRGLPELKDSDFGNFSPRCDKFTASRAADRRRRSENVDGVQPLLRQSGPVRDWQFGRAQSKPVSTLRKEVEFGWNLCVLQRLKVHQRILHVGRVVVLRLHQKSWRNARGWEQRRGDLAICAAQPARIEDHLKVGTRVDRGRRHALALEVRMRTQHSSQMRPGREPDHADAVRIDVPLRRVAAGEPHRLLRVFQVFHILRKMTLLRNPVLHQDACDANGIEPRTYLGTFHVITQAQIGAARENKGRGARVAGRLWRVNHEARLTYVRNSSRHLAGYDAIGVRSRIHLGPHHPGWLRIPIGPQLERRLLSGSG